MRTWFRCLSPLLLPFLLSLFPVIVTIYFQDLRHQLEQERDLETWVEKVENRVETFRAGYSFEQQIRQRSEDFQARLLQAVRRSPTKKLTGSLLAQEFHRTFHGFHRPAGTRLYVFARDPDGRPELLTGTGLEEEFGRLIARCLSPLTLDTLPGGSVKKEGDQRLAQIFGDLMNGEQLFMCRGKRLIRANFQKQVVQVFWDRISDRGRVLGGFLILFPPLPDQRASLEYALARYAGGKDLDCVPLLVPIQAAQGSQRPLFLDRDTPRWGLGSVLKLFLLGADRDRIASFGQVSETIPGLKIFRAAVSTELPYEMWILKQERPTPEGVPETLTVASRREGTSATPAGQGVFRVSTWRRIGIPALIALAAWGIFWLGTFIQVIRNGRPFQISMRSWFQVYILLVGGVPLTTLFYVGTSLIDFAADRQIRQRITQTTSLFENLDLNSMTAMTTFVETGKEILADKALKAFLCSPEITNDHPTVRTIFSRFQRAGAPLDSLYLTQFGRKQLLLTRDPSTAAEPREIRELFLPLFHNVYMAYDPAGTGPALAALNEFQKWSTQLGSILFPAEQTRLAGNLRRVGSLYELGNQQVFHLFDFVAQGHRIQAALAFRAKASEAFWTGLKRQLPPLARQNPGRKFLCVWNSPTGKRWHFPHALAKDPPSRRLIQLMKQVSKIGAGQIQRSGGRAYIGFAGKRMKNLFLGAIVDFREVTRAARRQLGWLILGTLLIGGLMFLVGTAMERYFLEPLKVLETGFRRVLDRDLEIRLQLDRDDELGDVAAAFDQMVGGLKERRELGRFVSGTLDLSLGSTDSLPTEPEVKSGSVLASDIRNFTTISEQNPPEVVVEMLNHHLQAMSEEIKKQGGLIDKFIGDAMVAVFLEPDPATAAAKAVRAAQGMMRRHREILSARSTSGRVCYGMGVGIDTGEVLVGTFGSAGRLEFTILGTPRDAAEELEALSKQGRFSRIILSGRTAGLQPLIETSALPGDAGFEVINL